MEAQLPLAYTSRRHATGTESFAISVNVYYLHHHLTVGGSLLLLSGRPALKQCHHLFMDLHAKNIFSVLGTTS